MKVYYSDPTIEIIKVKEISCPIYKTQNLRFAINEFCPYCNKNGKVSKLKVIL